MLSHLLFLAAATAEHGEAAATGITKITQDFGINIPSILAQMLSFGIVAYILWRFGFKPVLATIDERQKKIDSGLAYAEEMKAKLDAAQQESAKILKTAQQDAQKVVDEARQVAKTFAEKQQKEAAEQAGAILAKAQQTIELERKKMLDETRGEIARLVVVTTERVLTKRLTDADRAAYNDTAARELTVL